MAFENEPPAGPPEPEPTLLEIVEKAGRQIGTAMVVGAAFIALAIYARPGPPRYQALSAGAEVIRIDTRSGVMIGCGAGQCYSIRQRGDALAPRAPAAPPAVPKAPAAAAPALPVPQAAPAAR
jgi:hypothetical protein